MKSFMKKFVLIILLLSVNLISATLSEHEFNDIKKEYFLALAGTRAFIFSGNKYANSERYCRLVGIKEKLESARDEQKKEFSDLDNVLKEIYGKLPLDCKMLHIMRKHKYKFALAVSAAATIYWFREISRKFTRR